MLAGLGLHFGTVQTHITQLHQFHLTTNMQYLNKESLKLAQKATAKRGDAVMVRMLVGTEIAKGNRVMRGSLKFATRKYAWGR